MVVFEDNNSKKIQANKYDTTGQNILSTEVLTNFAENTGHSLPLIILGGILGGIFTQTEAAAVSAAVAFFLGSLYLQH